jgi:hypothetical protein
MQGKISEQLSQLLKIVLFPLDNLVKNIILLEYLMEVLWQYKRLFQ